MGSNMIRPLGDYVLILPDSLEEKLPSGIILPEKQSDTPVTGIVIASNNIYKIVKRKVWFKMWAGEDVKYKNRAYKLVHIKDIIAYEI